MSLDFLSLQFKRPFTTRRSYIRCEVIDERTEHSPQQVTNLLGTPVRFPVYFGTKKDLISLIISIHCLSLSSVILFRTFRFRCHVVQWLLKSLVLVSLGPGTRYGHLTSTTTLLPHTPTQKGSPPTCLPRGRP